MNINELNLSARAAKALEAAEITTVEDLKALDDKALADIKGLGPKAVEEVKAAIEAPEGNSEEASEEPEEFAKAGKRSKKAAQEAEAEAEKEARKERIASGEEIPEDAPVKRGPVPVTRPKIERRSKNYRKSAELIKEETYDLKSAIDLAIKTSTTKFDGSVEIHLNLNVNPTHADQNVRSTIVLPNGTGKEVRVAVFTTEDKHKDAKAAGADFVGDEDFLAKLKKEELDFDVLIASPDVMAKLGQYARLLGPKGLMPNPKSGTVSKNVAAAVKEAKAGKIEYRVDSRGIIHNSIGKVSFGTDKLVDSISSNKPASVKGALIERVSINATMGPGIRVKL